MSPISRRKFGWILAGSGSAALWFFGYWRVASGQSTDDDLLLINGWLVNRAQVAKWDLQGVLPIDI
jgi:hypothetical protein